MGRIEHDRGTDELAGGAGSTMTVGPDGTVCEALDGGWLIGGVPI